MYGESARTNYAPFVDNRAPVLLKDHQSLEVLRKYIPDLYKGENSTKTCCSVDQLTVLQELTSNLLSNFIRCSTCLYNINQISFNMVCAPDQSRFIKVTGSKYSKHFKKKYVTSIDFHMNMNSMENILRSCHSVQTSASQSVLAALCGTDEVEECTPKKYLDAISGKSPYKMNAKLSNKPATENGSTYFPLEIKYYPCYSIIHGKRCRPEDCIDTEIITVAPKPTTIGVDMVSENGSTLENSLDNAVISAVVIFSVGFIICCVFLVISLKRSKNIEHNETEQLKTENKQDQVPDVTDESEKKSNYIKSEDISTLEKITAETEEVLRKIFQKWGKTAARHPYIVIACSIIICGALSCGMFKFGVITDPIELWAAPHSKSRLDREYYNKHFGPFYRSEQIIIKPKDQSTFTSEIKGINRTFGPVFRQDFLAEVLHLQNQIQSITAKYNNEAITLQDICFRPLYPEYKDCTIQTTLNYFQNNMTKLLENDYLDHLSHCMSGYLWKPDCFGAYGGPIQPEVVLGGFPESKHELSKALVITFVNDNSLDTEKLAKAKAWELQYVNFLKEHKSNDYTFAFNSERSIEDELERGSRGDIYTIFISYAVMFTYITLALGQPRSFSTILVDSKISLGLAGVTIVILSVVSSIGFFSFIGVPATLIIIEVIPFLVLAIGVDNIFILVQALQRDKIRNGEDIESQIGRIVGDVGPSMLLSSISEACCFFLGTLSDMPAVKVFAMYAGLALLVDFLLQITCFVSLLTLDTKRQADNRWDVIFCVKNQKNVEHAASESLLYKFFKNNYAPALMNNWVRSIIVTLFLGWFCSSVLVVNKLAVGLDQELAVPEDSFVVNYFSNLKEYLSVGPPVYFVITGGYQYDTVEDQSRLCSISSRCKEDSFSARIVNATKHSKQSKLQGAYFSWINGYQSFMCNDNCCLFYKSNHSYCPFSVGLIPNGVVPKLNNKCARCAYSSWDEWPTGKDFYNYLPYFTNQQPTKYCPDGGQANYKYYIETKRQLIEVNGTEIIGDKPEATMFMLYHTVLKSSADYVDALYSARQLEDELNKYLHDTDDDPNPKYRVFAYSVFYVFYEQYLTTWPDTIKSLGISVATIFCVLLILTGFELIASVIIVVTICLIIVNLLGLMYWWSISLNAVALVNLIMAVGISVEFCSHITRSFSSSIQLTRVGRAQESLAKMGSSVLSGITLTKFGGIVVLAFAKSRIFQVYYFRLYLCIVLFGAAHGLILLPVILSIFGPSLNKKKYLHKTELQKENDSKKHPQQSFVAMTDMW